MLHRPGIITQRQRLPHLWMRHLPVSSHFGFEADEGEAPEIVYVLDFGLQAGEVVERFLRLEAHGSDVFVRAFWG